MRVQDIIIKPLITEKSTALRDEKNVVAFHVDRRANKVQIKTAVEHQFKNVVVSEVRVANVHGKIRRQGRFVGKRPDWKKAYVRLASGQIDLFDGI